MARYLDAIAGTTPEPFNFRAGLRIQQLVETIHRSSREGGWRADRVKSAGIGGGAMQQSLTNLSRRNIHFATAWEPLGRKEKRRELCRMRSSSDTV